MSRRIRPLVLALVAVLAVAGCEESPLESESTDQEDAVSSAPAAASPLQSDDDLDGAHADPSALARFRDGPPSITIGWAKKTIGPEGGSLRLLDFEIVVPPGAVDRATRFQIRLPVDPHQREYVMAEFGPHGREFAVPVRIRFPLRGTTIEESDAAGVVWWDGEEWTRLPTEVIEDGERLEGTTDHFSTFGTSEESAFGEMSSGG